MKKEERRITKRGWGRAGGEDIVYGFVVRAGHVARVW